jgi:hypothetical protein
MMKRGTFKTLACLTLGWACAVIAEPVSLQGIVITTNNTSGTPPRFTKSAAVAGEKVEKAVMGRDADGNTLQVSRALKRQDGATLATATSRVIELTPGANSFNAITRSWGAAGESLAASRIGAEGQFGDYSVRFAGNCNSAGAIELTLPNGVVLRSHVLGLYYSDTSSGKSVLLAPLKDSLGATTPKREVVYADAFEGVSADLVYRASATAFEQDVILRGRLPRDPASFGFDPESTVIEVVTEFLDEIEPTIIEQLPDDGAGGEVAPEPQISFGSMRLALGRTFGTGFKQSIPDRTDIPVLKRWIVAGNRRLLIESVPFSQVKPLADKLAPRIAAGAKLDVAANRVLPPAPKMRLQIAMLATKADPYAQPGVVIDYVLVPNTTSGGYPYTFQSGQTYLISGSIWLQSGAVFQQNAVIKFARGADLTISGSITCPTTGRCILTAIDDHTVGEKLTDNPVVGTYATIGLTVYSWSGTRYINNLDIRYAEKALRFYTSSSVFVTDVDVIRSTLAASAYYSMVNWTGGTWCDVGSAFYNHGGGSTFTGGPAVTLVGANDNDGDLLGNIDELTRTKSNPLNAYSKSANKKDGEFMLLGGQGGADSNVRLDIVYVTYFSAQNYTEIKLRVSNTPLDYTWDVFYAELLSPTAWRLVWSGWPPIGWGTSTHEYIFQLDGSPPQGYFQVFAHEDADFDGIADGYEVAVLKTMTGNPDSNSIRDSNGDGQPDYPGLGDNGIADGDEDFDADTLSNAYELQLGVNPLSPQNNSLDSDADGLPNWVEELIIFYTPDPNPSPTGDSDGDGVDNFTEWSIKTDPSYPYDLAFADLWNLPDEQRVITPLHLEVTAPPPAGGLGEVIPSDDEAYVIFTIAGPEGSCANLQVLKDTAADGSSQPGTDLFRWSIGFGQKMFSIVPNLEPDDQDLALIQTLVLTATSLADDIWQKAKISENLHQLTANSLVYLQYRSAQRVLIEFKTIQITQQQIPLPQGTLLRMRRSLAVVHTEATVFRSVTFELGQRYPGHDAFARSGAKILGAAGKFAQCLSIINNAKQTWPLLEQYLYDVRARCDSGASADLLGFALAQMADDFRAGFVLFPFPYMFGEALCLINPGCDSTCN